MPVELDLEDRIRPDLGTEASDLATAELLDEGGDRVAEEAQHDMGRQVERLDRQVRFQYGVARRVELQDRGVV